MRRLLFLLWFCVVGAGLARGQQVTMSTPMHHLNSSFNESIGTSWGVSSKNGFFRFNGGGVPATNSTGGMQTGFPIKVGGMNGYFNGWAGQSYSASNSVYAPSVTSMNGYPAYIGAGSATPFVIGVTPVVGDWSHHSLYPSLPSMDYSAHSVLQERVRRMEEEKAFQGERRERTRRTVADLTPVPKKEKRSTSTQTAERPAKSVLEMKRLREAEQRERETR
ncbi:MAG: hypothetical protein Q4D98_12330 [Planctomycetia bacterium]|nr:hypothetical protein [Planctomycetia bacterium]